jgi:biotin carboxylase
MRDQPFTILALASYEKGYDFLREAKRIGVRVFLLTSLSLKDRAWPSEAIDEIFYMPDERNVWNREHARKAVCYLLRSQRIDRIVPLDDFDLEMAAFLREHTRIAGMGESQTRYFRDKLAMRMRAAEAGIPVPEFAGVLHHPTVDDFTRRAGPPWVLKPRLLAGAIGIQKIHSSAELWAKIHALGDEQSNYLVERFVPGDIYHADSIVFGGEIRFAVASRYGSPPMEISQGGGIFTTRLLDRQSEMNRRILDRNRQVLEAMGLAGGVSHTEFIHGRDDGEIYFLETSARVGGANIADLVEAATGVNPWKEWAKLECADAVGGYSLGQVRPDYAGLLVSLARQEYPDASSFRDPEICWRMSKRHHIGLIVRSPSLARVEELLDGYTTRVRNEFHASLPPKERPTE